MPNLADAAVKLNPPVLQPPLKRLLYTVCRGAPWDRAHYQHTAWGWTQCCRFDRWWPVGCARLFCVFRCRVLACLPKPARHERSVNDAVELRIKSSGTGGGVSTWLRRWWECRWSYGWMLLPATKSELRSFPGSWITLIGDTPMHHESLKVHGEYVEKLVDVNRPDVQYAFW